MNSKPKDKQEKLKALVKEIEEHAQKVLFPAGLFQVVMTSQEWQTLKEKYLGG